MALLQIDLCNTYGRAYRSSMLIAAAQHAPAVATLMASQWQGANIAWMRVSGKWTAIPTVREGWQGSAAMPVTFALALEVCMRVVTGPLAGPADTPADGSAQASHVVRIGYAGRLATARHGA